MIPSRSLRRALLGLLPCLLAVLVPHTAAAQCSAVWLPGSPAAGVDGVVACATSWDPDGPGPLTERLVVGGQFWTAGNVLANSIAAWDPATGTWSAFAGGFDGFVRALVAAPNGDLFAAGTFAAAGGMPANGIARWTAGTWSPLGTGCSTVMTLALRPNGDLIAGGSFSQAGGVPALNVARWDGAVWSTIGGVDGLVTALATAPNGDVVAAGPFQHAGGVACSSIARWNGAAWSAFPASGLGTIGRVAVRANGNVIAAAQFVSAALPTLAEWNGAAWTPLGAGPGSTASALQLLPNGDLIAACVLPVAIVARWDGVVWSPIGDPRVGEVYALARLPGGNVTAAGEAPLRIAEWNGTTWSAIGSGGSDGAVHAVLELPNGDAVVGGTFSRLGGIAAERVAAWSNGAWTPLGSGMDGDVLALARRANGELVAGGSFTSAGGVAAPRVAVWNGAAWAPLGALDRPIVALAVMPNGDVFAGSEQALLGSQSFLARWNGVVWSTSPAVNHRVADLLVEPDGNLLIGSLGGVLRWNGTSLTPLGAPVTATAIDRLPDGDVVAATSSGVERWNGASWSSVGSAAPGDYRAVAALPNGHVLAARWIAVPAASGFVFTHVDRWDGTAWRPHGGAARAGLPYPALALTTLATGDVALHGVFGSVSGTVAGGFARLAPTCRAFAIPTGSACIGGSGPMSLTAPALPWAGGQFRGACAGLSPTDANFAVFGFASPNVAWSLLHPAGSAGCAMMASPDALLPLSPVAGHAGYALGIPPAPSLAGAVVFTQVVALTLGPQLQLLGLASSNGLRLTVGAW